MRAVALLLFALVLSHSAAAQEAPATQPQARALEERWKNCSEVIHGRLGALHSVGDMNSNYMLTFTTAYEAKGELTQIYPNVTVTYSPCVAPFLTIEDTLDPRTLTVELNDYVPFDDRVVDFVMQETSSDTTHFTGIYYNAEYHITVVTNCVDGKDALESKNITLTKGEDGKLMGTIVFQTNEACPRFPYTNKNMPGGAIAALVVMLVCFVLELGVCGWYHKTYAVDSPFTTNAEYNTME